MALLAIVQREDGEWSAFVLPHMQRRWEGAEDVLGRAVPAFRYIEVHDGVKKADAPRLAQELRGLPRERRHEACLQRAQGLRLALRGGTPL